MRPDPKFDLFERVLIVSTGDESDGANKAMRDMVGQETIITGRFWSQTYYTYYYQVNRRSFYWEEDCFEPIKM